MKSPSALRLFLFPHAGGSQLLFREWTSLFPDDWRFLPQDYPGHGLLAGLAPLDDADTLVDWFLDRLDAEFGDPDVPFACFGHSMGSLVAFEVTRRLVERGGPRPVWLGLSGCGAPYTTREPVAAGELTDAELRRRLVRLGGTPPRILDDPELWSVFAPVIRADVTLVANWRPPRRLTPLPVPLTVFHGTQDVLAPDGPLEEWADSTTDFVGVRRFDGGHFYFQDDPERLAALITGDVRRSLVRAAATRGTRRFLEDNSRTA
ncbi:thioesterase II family protein [Streptomyces abyssomicinicus]|uniref:thioesterase II family protein n=1 Tax=Streptomyces abyssomicinicus TaxID=574929 RepID=UPI00125097AC|nr:alpha/beta fold hydrolase [Streptomyces abyssomicinicus]